MLDIDRLRADTPGCEHVIHLNNAGAGLMPAPVVSAVQDHIALESRMGGYEAAADRRDAIEDARAAVARLIGAESRNIAYMENATVAFHSAVSSFSFGRDDLILTSRNDYISNQITYMSLRQRMGVETVYAPDLPEGGVDPLAAEEIIHRRRPKLVAMTHVPTNSGLVQQLAHIGRACRDRHIPFLVDACQSVGQLHVDIHELNCDFMSATARKFLRGPRGCGFLYISDAALDSGVEPLFIDMQGAHWVAPDLYQPVPDARRFENWEFAYALILGLGAAAEYALNVGIDEIEPRVKELATFTRERLEGIEGATVLDVGPELCGIVTVALDGVDPGDAVRQLRARGVNTSSSAWEYAVLDFTDKGVEGALRISPSYYNTTHEIESAVAAIEEIAQ
jgi:selenocysteine lyase/cysteine desulfurase